MTLVRELVLLVARGGAAGVPSAHVVRLFPSGALGIEGPVAAGGPDVARAAQLLDSLLPGFDAPSELHVPGALRLIVARASGTLDLPPYVSLDEFATALTRFASSDAASVVRELVAAATPSVAPAPMPAEGVVNAGTPEEPVSPVLEEFAATSAAAAAAEARTELTVSDIRRARRATGLTLVQVSERSRIPVSLLRQLEWGYLANWPAGHYGRTQLVRYARAAGLDEQVVVRTMTPVLEEAVATAVATDVVAPATVPVEELVPVPRVEPPVLVHRAPLETVELSRTPHLFEDRAPRSTRRRTRVLAALAIPALIAIGVVPAVWDRLPALEPGEPEPVAATTGTSSGPPAPAEPAEQRPAPPARAGAERDGGPAPAAARRGPVVPEAPQQIPVANAQPARGLTEDAVAYSPSFGSAGSAMFYHAQDRDRSALMRADTDGSGAVLRITRIVNDSARNFHVRPSPDGSSIAFDSDRDGERGVYVADADGKHVRKISGEGFAAIPSWSPDGGTLAYVRAEPDRPRVWNLWTTDLASGETRQLTHYRVGQPWGGSWFPDGRRIAYSHEDRLVVLDLERGTQRVFPSPRKGRLVRTPAVSPDGRLVIFQVFRDGAWILDMTDGSMRKVLADPSAEEYTWSPDGRRVAYHSRESGQWGVWVMAPRD